MAAKPSSTRRSPREAKSDLAVSYNDFKEHEGQRYTGMKIGRSHKWYYDQGEWKETKITFLRTVLADLVKQTDRERALTAGRDTPPARRPRRARMRRAITTPRTGRQRRAKRASAPRHLHRAARVR